MHYEIVKSYFDNNTLAQHQIKSFNTFIDTHIQNIVDEVGDISLKNGNTGLPVMYQAVIYGILPTIKNSIKPIKILFAKLSLNQDL